ncbi:MAG: ring-cleaving dioxygenase, partial [Rhizobiales bacterium]|nr:ring-cleaving dioxygenase [Hyphomicrobiales bacterium]
MSKSAGLHHVTAVSGVPKENVAFYTQVLGLRMVKQTVNYDDPGTWHLYYGDGPANPGSILTFFPWTHVGPRRAGSGETG